jgi:hypothetical protein
VKRLLFAVAAMPLIAGCSRVAVTTEVKPDGSWTRQDVFTQAKSGMGGAQLSDVFTLPAQGAGWTAKKTVTVKEVTYTASLKVKGPGQFGKDIMVRRKEKGPVLVTNTVVVRQIAPGRWQYTETLHWAGDKPAELANPPADAIAAIKGALPASIATEANAKALAVGLVRGLWGAMFGPGQSVLPQLMLQPDAAEHILLQRLGRSIDRTLGETVGSRLTAEERRATVKKLIGVMSAQAQAKGSPEPGGSSSASKDGTDMPSMTFTLKPPGTVVETNGESDEYANEVWWTLYPEAAALGDIVLKATWKTAPPK